MGARRGLTLLEVLIAVLIMGIGLVAVASLFPVGISYVGQANRDTRAVMLAQCARSQILSARYIERLLGTAGNDLGAAGADTDCFRNPITGWTDLTAAGSTGRSYALVVDPVGGAYWARQAPADRHQVDPSATVGMDAMWTLAYLPRFPMFRQYGNGAFVNTAAALFPGTVGDMETVAAGDFYDAVLGVGIYADVRLARRAAFALAGSPDDIAWNDSDTGAGRGAPRFEDLDSDGVVDGWAGTDWWTNEVDPVTRRFSRLRRERNFSWLAVVQMPDVRNPKVFELRIAVFRSRDLTIDGERCLHSAVQQDAGSSSMLIQWPTGSAAPTVEPYAYVLDAHNRRGYFYRVLDAGPITVNGANLQRVLTLETPLREGGVGPAAPWPVLLPGLVEVFESTVVLP